MPTAALSASARMILTLIDEVRPKTCHLLESATSEELLWSPPGTQNHIAWHAGHAVWLADTLCVRPVIGGSELPDEWSEVFGQDRTPPSRTSDWPDKRSLISALRLQHVRVRGLVESLSDAQLGGIVPRSNSTLARLVIHGFHDEANHQGEMYLLLKMQRA